MINQFRNYFINGYDVTPFVIGLHPTLFPQLKPRWGDLPALPKIQVTVANLNGEFTQHNKYSLFHRGRLKNMMLKVVLNAPTGSFTEWEGIIDSVDEDHELKRASINGVSHYQRALDMPSLVFLDNATPASLSRELFNLFNIPVNEESYTKAISDQNGLVTCQLDPNLLQSQVTLQEIQKHLCTAGYGRIYYYNGEMYYEVYTSTPSFSPISIGERDFMIHPRVTTEEPTKPYIYNDSPFPYTVTMILGDVHSKSWTLGANSEYLDFGPNSLVKILDTSSAQQVADQWEIIHDLSTIRVDFAVLPDIGTAFTLKSYVNINWPASGFDLENLAIIGIDRTDPRYTKLSARTL